VGVSAVPTPLYPLYERRDAFGAGTVTIIFAAFSVSVAFSLVFLGPVSDRIGRRRAMIPALLLDGVSCALFIAWPTVVGLLIARALCGLSVGVIAASATAYLSDLQKPTAGEGRRAAAEVTATAANLGGVGIGALLAGLLAQFAPSPLRLSYLVYLALLLTTAALLSRLPERARGRAGANRALGIRFSSRPRRRYFCAALGALLALSALGLFASLAPSFLADVLHQRSHALAGAIAFVAFVSAAVGQLLLGTISPRWALLVGCGAILVGLALMTLGLWTSEWPVFLASGCSTGVGSGLVFKRCLGIAVDMASPERRAESSAGVFLASYLGLAVSIVGLGALTDVLSARVALLTFALVIAGGVAALLVIETALGPPASPDGHPTAEHRQRVQ